MTMYSDIMDVCDVYPRYIFVPWLCYKLCVTNNECLLVLLWLCCREPNNILYIVKWWVLMTNANRANTMLTADRANVLIQVLRVFLETFVLYTRCKWHNIYTENWSAYLLNDWINKDLFFSVMAVPVLMKTRWGIFRKMLFLLFVCVNKTILVIAVSVVLYLFICMLLLLLLLGV